MDFGQITTDAVNSAVEGASYQVSSAVVQTATNAASTVANMIGGPVGGMINSALSSFNGIMSGMGPPYPNTLNQYASYNYLFTLSPLSNHEINYPELTYRIMPPSRVVLRSGGSGSKKITGMQENLLGITADLYIEDVEMTCIFGPNPATHTSNVVGIDFTVVEPYSMGMFIENLKAAAESKGFPNYINAPFLFTLEFIGWDDKGNLLKVPNTTRMYPVHLVQADFTVDQSGSKYQVKAVAWNDAAFSDEVQSVKTDSDLEGETVNELLQTGPKSLASLLNTREQKLKNDGHKADADEYIILFPNERETNIASAESSGESPTTDEFVEQMYGTEDVPDVSGSPEEEKEKILGFDMSTGTIGDQLRDYSLDDSKLNEIGRSKISKGFITQGTPYFGRAAFVENEDEPGTFKRDKIVASEDGTRLTFKRGERIEDIIEEVIMLSEYAREFPSKEEDENGMKELFRIESNVYVGESSDNMSKTGRKPYVYVYKVIPYKINTSSYKTPTANTPEVQSLARQVMKEYNYIYTGKNDSILDFNIEINYVYYSGLQSDLTDFSTTRVINSSEMAVEDEGEEDVDFTVGEDGDIPEEGAYTVTQTVGTHTGAMGGGSKNHTESRATRNIGDIISNGSDLAHLELTIMGDPYYIIDSGMGNYTAGETDFINLTLDGTMDYQYSEVDIGVKFRTPVDIGQNGLMQFAGGETSEITAFSGLYLVTQIINKFNNGKFTQLLTMSKRHNLGEKLTGGGISKPTIVKENSEEGGAEAGADSSSPASTPSTSTASSGSVVDSIPTSTGRPVDDIPTSI